MGVWIGTSGWSYDHWTGVLYPPGLPAAARLERYCEVFDTVELNGSFYRWPRPQTFAGWRQRLPDGFRMVVKAPRGLTHARRLGHPEVWVPRLCAGWDALGDRAAVLLVQLPPTMPRDDERLEVFLAQLPPRIQVAVEFRHDSWQERGVEELLARHRAAYVVTSGPGLPCLLHATAPLVYVRFHGTDPQSRYAGSYSTAELAGWAGRIRAWRDAGLDVYAFFNNDREGHAVRNALELRRLLAG